MATVEIENEQAAVTRFGMLDMQVCVPSDWEDAKIISFAERSFPCGTTNGWQIRREGSALLAGHPERVNCAERTGFVHVVLDA